jgi:hypothetical protein
MRVTYCYVKKYNTAIFTTNEQFAIVTAIPNQGNGGAVSFENTNGAAMFQFPYNEEVVVTTGCKTHHLERMPSTCLLQQDPCQTL